MRESLVEAWCQPTPVTPTLNGRCREGREGRVQGVAGCWAGCWVVGWVGGVRVWAEVEKVGWGWVWLWWGV